MFLDTQIASELASVINAIVNMSVEINIFSTTFPKAFGYIMWIRIEISYIRGGGRGDRDGEHM